MRMTRRRSSGTPARPAVIRFCFRHGVSKATFGAIDSFTWKSLMRWIRVKYAGRTGLSRKQLRRRFCDKGWRFAHNGAVFTGTSSVAVTRYRYRGSNIPTPWTPKPAAATTGGWPTGKTRGAPGAWRHARRVRRAGRGNSPGVIPAGRPGPT
ncbi:group II intron maturase-specific domain-containing protein [Streptomyces sp. MMS24-I2-30]|uniref:group II intron maturase-specific domain-containing protein n=1 Tax=Streptomyces sp. MMS24-I2-30 TaxID=3351564 RepID=UPI003896E19B